MKKATANMSEKDLRQHIRIIFERKFYIPDYLYFDHERCVYRPTDETCEKQLKASMEQTVHFCWFEAGFHARMIEERG